MLWVEEMVWIEIVCWLVGLWDCMIVGWVLDCGTGNLGIVGVCGYSAWMILGSGEVEGSDYGFLAR